MEALKPGERLDRARRLQVLVATALCRRVSRTVAIDALRPRLSRDVFFLPASLRDDCAPARIRRILKSERRQTRLQGRPNRAHLIAEAGLYSGDFGHAGYGDEGEQEPVSRQRCIVQKGHRDTSLDLGVR